jgi:hypothetical protein
MHARKSRSEWSTIIKAFERSGMPHEAFCSTRGLNVGTFRAWLYRLRREVSLPSPSVALLPVEVTPATMLTVAPEVVITISGFEVRVPVGADVGYVVGLVAELRSRC